MSCQPWLNSGLDMNVNQLIAKLQKLVKENPKAGDKDVVLCQYDLSESEQFGYVNADRVTEHFNRVEID